jgi:hypothetical protein
MSLSRGMPPQSIVRVAMEQTIACGERIRTVREHAKGVNGTNG